MKFFLQTISYLYSKTIDARNYLFSQGYLPVYQSSIPVLCVGNITIGGNGKTPLVILLADLLREYKPVVLTRGYGGSEKGPYLVQDSDSPATVGDEALLIKQEARVPVVVGADRTCGAKFIEKQALGKMIILDDGFQHRWLARALDLVMIDIGTKSKFDDLLNARLLPYGSCRENPVRALQRAGAVVLTDRGKRVSFENASKSLTTTFASALPFFHCSFVAGEIVSLNDASKISAKQIVAFCGLASPDSFFSMLKEQGFDLIGQESFPDHFKFSQQTIKQLESRYPNTALVCTAKDAIKISPEWCTNLYCVKGACQISDESQFKQLIEEKLLINNS